MIKKLFSYQDNGIRYTYFRDCRMTLVYGELMSEPDKVMFGTAFCIQGDEYNEAIGCKVALKRYCKNLKLSRKIRMQLQDTLEVNLGNYMMKNFFKELLAIVRPGASE